MMREMGMLRGALLSATAVFEWGTGFQSMTCFFKSVLQMSADKARGLWTSRSGLEGTVVGGVWDVT